MGNCGPAISKKGQSQDGGGFGKQRSNLQGSQKRLENISSDHQLLELFKCKLRKPELGLFSELKIEGNDGNGESFGGECFTQEKKEAKDEIQLRLEEVPEYLKIQLCNGVDEDDEDKFSDSEQFCQQGFSPENVPQNKLFKVQNPQNYPENGFGCVEIFGSDKNPTKLKPWHLRGTGTLISRKHVLTCSHIFVNSRRAVGKKCEYVFYFNNKMERYRVKNIYSFEHYFVTGSQERYGNDIALLELEEPVPHHHGYSGYDFTQRNCELTREVNVSGYPKDQIQLYKSLGKITEIEKDVFLYHNCGTSRGVSGGSIIKFENEKPFVIGIHQGSSKYQSSRKKAVMFNERIRKIFASWLQLDKVELNLNRQELGSCSLNMKQIQLLRSGQFHKKITHLRLDGHQISSKQLKILFKKPEEWKIKVLQLSNNKLIDQDIQIIRKHLSLKQLDLSSNKDITSAGISGLSYLKLQTLNLSNIPLGGDIFDALVKFNNLVNLNMRNCSKNPKQSFGPKELKTTYAEAYENLKAIDMGDNKIGVNGIEFLCLLKNIQRIKLDNCSIGDKGLAKLCEGQFDRIKEFSLRNNQLTSLQINKLNQFYSLNHLDLGHNPIGNSGFLMIYSFPFFISHIVLTHTQLNDQCFENLDDTQVIEYVQTLNLSKNDISERGLYNLLIRKLNSIHKIYLNETKVRMHIQDKISKAEELRILARDQSFLKTLKR